MYDPISEDAIMPVQDWAKLFAGDMFKKRLQPDYLSRLRTYQAGFGKTLEELGKSGPFWGR